MNANPWGLTPRQCEVMDRLIATGCNKEVARQLGVHLSTVENHLAKVYDRMQRPRLLAVVTFDRWRTSRSPKE